MSRKLNVSTDSNVSKLKYLLFKFTKNVFYEMAISRLKPTKMTFLILVYNLVQSVQGKVRKKAKIGNRNNQVPHLSQDTTSESDKNTRKHHKQESQEVSPFPAGDHKAAMNSQDSVTDTTNEKDPQKKHRLGTVRKKILEGYTYLSVPTSSLFLMWIKTNRFLIRM